MQTLKTIVAAMALLVLPGISMADPAIVITVNGCGLSDGNGNPVNSGNTFKVSTQSANDNFLAKCNTTVEPASSGNEVMFDFGNTGFTCNARDPVTGDVRSTEDWFQIVAPSGQTTLICKFKN